MAIQANLTDDDLDREGIRPVGVGTISGAIDFAADEDYFFFVTEPGRQYAITVDAGFDTELGIYDPVTGQAVAADDDSGAGINPQILSSVSTVPAGIIIQVDAPGNGEPGDMDPEEILGDYDLIIQDLGLVDDLPDPPDISGGISTPAAIQPGQTVTSEIEEAGDIDAFRVFFQRGLAYSIAMDRVDETLDPFLQLIDSEGELVADNDQRDESDNAGIVFAPSETGFYLISASDAQMEAGSGAYELSVQTLGGIPVSSSGDSVGGTVDTAVPVEVGEVQVQAIETEGDIDFFALTLVEGNTYRIQALSREPAPMDDSPVFDPVLAIVNPDDLLVVEDDDGAGGVNAGVFFTPQQTGTFNIAVGSFGGESTGGYEFSVRVEEAAGIKTLDAQAIALLYEAGLGRQAAFTGLNFWIDRFEAGNTLVRIAQSFLDSNEFNMMVGDPDTLTNFEFIDGLAQNVLGRSLADEGQEFWEGRLEDGASRAQTLLAFATIGENAAQSPQVLTIEPIGDNEGETGLQDDILPEWDFIG